MRPNMDGEKVRNGQDRRNNFKCEELSKSLTWRFHLLNPRSRTILHLWIVQSEVEQEENLIIMNLQMAKESVNQVETVWIVMVKFVWKSRKVPQDQEY